MLDKYHWPRTGFSPKITNDLFISRLRSSFVKLSPKFAIPRLKLGLTYHETRVGVVAINNTMVRALCRSSDN